MAFRVNFVTFWVCCNAAFVIVVEGFTETPNANHEGVNDGSIGFLEVFAMYLATLVVYRVFFGLLHILKFKTLTSCFCCKKYKTPKFNFHDEVRKLRQETVDWNESIIEEDDADKTILGNQN